MTTAPLHADAGVQAEQPSDDIQKTLGLGPAKRGGTIVRIVLGLLALGALVFAGVRFFQARAEKGQLRYETAAVATGDLVVTATVKMVQAMSAQPRLDVPKPANAKDTATTEFTTALPTSIIILDPNIICLRM